MLRTLKNRICVISCIKYCFLLLFVAFVLTIGMGNTFSYVTTKTPSLVNLFLNGMNPDGDLVIQKTVSHPYGDSYIIPSDLAFTFEVKLGGEYANKTVKTTQGDKTADENGVITVTVTPGGRTTVYDIDEGTPVTVTETQIGNGFTPDTVSQDITIQKYQDNLLTFTNTYTPEQADTSALTVSGIKTLVGREWIAGDSFTFELAVNDNGSWTSLGTQTITYELVEQPDPEDPEKTVLVSKLDYDKFDFSELIRAYAFDTAGTYPFRVTEIEGTIGGLTYDKAESKFDILVGDADMDGYLEIQSVTTTTAANTVVENAAVSISFENKYAPVGSTEGFIEIRKVLEDTSGQNKAPAGYTFALYDEENNLIVTSDPTSSTGETSIRLVYEPADAGKTFTYILKETNAGQTVGAYVYDDAEYKIRISIVDNLDGTVSAYVYDLQETVENIANPAETERDSAELGESAGIGGSVETGDSAGNASSVENGSGTGNVAGFVSDGDAAAPTAPADAAGFDRADDTVSAGDAGMTAPAGSGNNVPVNTSKPLTPVAMIPEGVTDTYKAAFVNKYDPQDVSVFICGEKTLSGRSMKDGEFTFLLYKTDEQFTLTDSEQPVGRAGNAASAFCFEPLTFEKVGTYYYVVTEDASGQLGGVTYDDSRYLVTIAVTDENGILTAKASITDGFGEEKDIKFANSYQAAAVSLPLGGKKILSGAALKDYTFLFRLSVADENFTADSTAFRTATSNGDGDFSFADLTFTKAGIYRYVITEETSAAVEGMTYDDTVYQITVVVNDPGDGQLVITEYSITADGQSVSEILFENQYTAPERPDRPDEPGDPDKPGDPEDTDAPDTSEPTPPNQTDVPKTGDDSRLLLYIVIAGLGSATVLLLLLAGRRKRTKH